MISELIEYLIKIFKKLIIFLSQNSAEFRWNIFSSDNLFFFRFFLSQILIEGYRIGIFVIPFLKVFRFS